MPYVSPVNLVNPLGGCPRPEGADADADAEVANLAASSCSAHPTPSRERRPTPMSASSMIRGLYRGTSEQESPRFKKSAADRFCDSSNSEAPRLDSTLRRRMACNNAMRTSAELHSPKCPRRRSTPSLIPISTPSIAQLQLHNNTRTGRAGPVSLAASRRICSLVFKGVKGSRAFTCSDTRWPLSSPRHGQISSRPYARAPGPTIH